MRAQGAGKSSHKSILNSTGKEVLVTVGFTGNNYAALLTSSGGAITVGFGLLAGRER